MTMKSCRFYMKKYPEIEEVVMVNVRSIADMGAYVHLLEYDNIEGMILLSELSRRRIRSINKLIRVGRDEAVTVIRVDQNKGYIDLSKRRVSPEEVKECEDRYAKAKAVNSILRHVAETLQKQNEETAPTVEQLYEKTAWRFEAQGKTSKGVYEIFKSAVDNDNVFDECELEDDTKKLLLSIIKRRLTPQAFKIRSDIEVTCFAYEGIDAVKAALRAGIAIGTEELPVNIQLIAPPLYVVTTNTTERSDGLEILNKAIDEIKSKIEGSGGNFTVKMAPKVVTNIEDEELQNEMQRLELQNQEVAGDDDSEGDESGEGGDSEDEVKEGKDESGEE